MQRHKVLILAGAGIALLGLAFVLSACDTEASRASSNISKAADNFEVQRRIVFINAMTDRAMLTVEGRCSQEQTERKLAVTCKTGPTEFKKHFLGLAETISYVSEQLDPITVDTYHYRVIYAPSVLIPSIEFKK